jgi:hypothetical protein
MNDHCPFSTPIISHDFGCAHANEVTRRGGPDIACGMPDVQVRCESLFDALKLAALPEFGVPDDLTVMPHSALVKIQYGGLSGLLRLLDGVAGPVADVNALVERAVTHYSTLDAIPCGELVADITAHKLTRKVRR